MKIIKTKKGRYLNSTQADRLIKKLPEGIKYESIIISGLPTEENAKKKAMSCLAKHPSWTILYLSIDRLPLSIYYTVSYTIVKRVSEEMLGKNYILEDEDISL